MLKVAFAVAFIAGTSLPAMAMQGECLLIVRGKHYLDGPCRIDFIDKAGSFTMNADLPRGRPKYLTYLLIDETDGTAQGYWNENPLATHAQSPLNTMTRTGGCWRSDIATMCAWKPGTRPAR